MSENTTIACPQCGASIEIAEALTGGIRAQLRQEAERDAAKRQAELKRQQEAIREREEALLQQEEALDERVRERVRLERERVAEAARAKAQEEFAAQAKALEEENARHRKQVQEAQARELALMQRQREVEDREAALKLDVERAIEAQREAIRAEAVRAAEEAQALKSKSLEEENARQKAQLQEAQGRELALMQRQREVEEREAALKLEVERAIEAQREAIRAEAVRAAEAAQALKSQSLEEENARQKAQLQEAQARELDLLRRQQAVEEREAALRLEVERTLSEERAKIREEAMTKAAESSELKLREKEQLIEQLRREMAEVQRRASVGSQEGQGEALEKQLQERLEAAYPADRFEEVKKGAFGADIVQEVNGRMAAPAGKILWETKNTKDFQPAWLEKLRGDQQAAGADIAVIASVALPRDVRDFALLEDHGVWVTSHACAPALAAALRQTLIAAARERRVAAHQDSMKDVLYQYITGKEFRLRVQSIARAYEQMQSDLDAERRAMARIWKKREKQIGVVLLNVTEMYGEIEGLAGAGGALPRLEALSLEAIAVEEEDGDE